MVRLMSGVDLCYINVSSTDLEVHIIWKGLP